LVANWNLISVPAGTIAVHEISPKSNAAPVSCTDDVSVTISWQDTGTIISAPPKATACSPLLHYLQSIPHAVKKPQKSLGDT